MPLDPQFRTVLDTFESKGLTPLVRGDATQTRAHYRTLALSRRGPQYVPEPVASATDQHSPGGVPVRIYEPLQANGSTLIYLHGGGWVVGDVETHDPLCRRVTNGTGARVVSVDYRLAPEHPFPAGNRDVLAAYRWLARHYPQAPILVSGECAGGGLALGLALALRDSGGPDRMPAGIHVVSPFCDLALPPEDLGPVADSDPWLNRIALIQLAACYIHDADPGQALVSPARADLSGLPPLLIQAAEPEALFASAMRLADRARTAGVDVTFSPVADSVHSFVLFDFLPEADRALAQFAAFAQAACAG